MIEKELNVFLPGLDNQARFLRRKMELKEKKVLIIGSGSEEIAKLFLAETEENVELIVDEYNSLMNSRLLLGENKRITVRLMDFEVTDFDSSVFDIVYTQGAITNPKRNKIVKEIKRILKPSGILCVGEIVSLQKKLPQFVLDIYNSSELTPLLKDEIAKYYEERNFEVVETKDLSFTLSDFYSKSLYELKKSVNEMAENEKSYYKKLINMINHEAKAFLNQGADEFIGFHALILKKK